MRERRPCKKIPLSTNQDIYKMLLTSSFWENPSQTRVVLPSWSWNPSWT